MDKRRKRREAAIRWMDRNTPPGYPWRSTLMATVWGGIFAFLWSLTFFTKYHNLYYNVLFEWLPGASGRRVFNENAVMPEFIEIADGKLTGFVILTVAMVGLVGLHYSYHYQGSKSIYTMKRLPKNTELWRRCITLPVVLALGSGAVAAGLRALFYVFYMTITPESAIPPGQWIW